MFEKVSPESVGIKSENVIKFINTLNKRGANTHGILMARHGKIFAEGYYKPFSEDFLHRMYSQTKTLVSVAIGLLEEEKKLSLDDCIVKYFPDKIDGELPEYLDKQTIRDMLKMATVGECQWWFRSGDPDRTHLYLNDKRKTVPSGMRFKYDSASSQVLCSLVERLTGKRLLEFLKEKIFNHMGTFQNAVILKTANGDSWGDSALVCTMRDMASFGQLLLNGGKWQGQSLISERYVKEATSKQIDNRESIFYAPNAVGYGYQIFRICGNGFGLFGMGGQYTFCYPDKDLMVVITSDNQGNDWIVKLILNGIEDLVLDTAEEKEIAENSEQFNKLKTLLSSLELMSVKGLEDSSLRSYIDGKEFVCEQNALGIEKFTFKFDGKDRGEFLYTNAQGDKRLPFGVNFNVFGRFPQLGYSNEYGSLKTTDGFTYKDAVSIAWYDENKIAMFVQIIDRYFGNMRAIFSFSGDKVFASFSSTAENFLTEYSGEVKGTMKK